MKNNHLMDRALFVIILLLLFMIIVLPSNALISCNVTTTGTCGKTKLLLVRNDTGGWHNAHAQNLSVNTYPYSICCNADSDGETVTTACDSLSPSFIKLSNITNAHLEIPSNTNYLYNACIGVTNRNLTCSNYTGSCPVGYTCIASIASSTPADNNATNAHIDANCSASYSTKICCGYSNRLPTVSSAIILPSPAYRNESLRGYCTASDLDLNTLTYNYTWYKNTVLNTTGITGSYAQGVQVNVGNISNTSLVVGDNWTLQCVANDGTSYSLGLNSTPTTIQALMPETVNLKSPSNGNNTVRDRRPILQWNNTNHTSRYEINITSSTGCGGNYYQNITYPTLNFTPTNELCVYSEGPNTLYRWAVRACGIDGCANWSATWNFTVQPYVSISLVNGSINFSSMVLGQKKNTSTGNPGPFVIQNDGNVVADLVNVSAEQNIWSSVPLNTEYFQMKSRVSNETGSFNISGSITSWVNISASNQTIIRKLNYSDSNDSAYLDIQVTVPGAEPPGAKQAYVMFRWTETP
jgi:hypothetical protein